MKVTHGIHVTFTEDRGDGGVAEAARYVGAWAGCVPRSAAWKALVRTIPGFDDLGDDEDEYAAAYEQALRLLIDRLLPEG
jgi:hypothetical protein